VYKAKSVRAKWFRTDQLGIDDLKNRCFNEAREFSYFRKGEWTGILASIENAEAFHVAHAMIVMGAIAAYPGARQLVHDAARVVGAGAKKTAEVLSKYWRARARKNYVCRRVICSSGVSKANIRKWEAICGEGGVVTIPKSQVGPFTYVVSDRMWAMFTRFGPNDLRGLEGDDKDTIAMLRQRFDVEFFQGKMEKR